MKVYEPCVMFSIFSRIVAKRSVLHCFVNTEQAELMTGTRWNTLFLYVTVEVGNGL